MVTELENYGAKTRPFYPSGTLIESNGKRFRIGLWESIHGITYEFTDLSEDNITDNFFRSPKVVDENIKSGKIKIIKLA